MAVEKLLADEGLQVQSIQLGEVEVAGKPEKAVLQKLDADLQAIGFALMDDKKSRLIERMKNVIIQHVHHSDMPGDKHLSDLITESIHNDYNYLSNLFSEVEGITLEKFYIRQKIERVKELLAYDEDSITNIAYQTGYSSAAHLSRQFKEITGFTPSAFKALKGHRKPLDKL
ncbi:helix-turn-helix domain-containing protein [Deminuibacter soli]|nr:AraC family transcriptional regulator [Deminuibacter soli]